MSKVFIPSGFTDWQAKPYSTQVTPTPWLFQAEEPQMGSRTDFSTAGPQGALFQPIYRRDRRAGGGPPDWVRANPAEPLSPAEQQLQYRGEYSIRGV